MSPESIGLEKMVMVEDLQAGDMVLTKTNDTFIIEKRTLKRSTKVKAYVLRGTFRGIQEYSFSESSIYYYGVHIRGGEILLGV